ncbi:unnamed protein product [Boreogadus saida]
MLTEPPSNRGWGEEREHAGGYTTDAARHRNAVATAGTSEGENEETCANSRDKQSRTQSRRVVVLNVGRGGSVNGFTGGVPVGVLLALAVLKEQNERDPELEVVQQCFRGQQLRRAVFAWLSSNALRFPTTYR